MCASRSENPVDTRHESADGTRLEYTDPRVALLVEGITKRLRPVCAGWEEDRFQALVHQIARMRVRWGELDGTTPHHFE